MKQLIELVWGNELKNNQQRDKLKLKWEKKK
mgnify:CR=1 FL=1